MKKKYILLSAILGVGLGLSSCADQLDADRYFKDRMSLEDVFSSRDYTDCLLYTSPSPRDRTRSRMPSSA